MTSLSTVSKRSMKSAPWQKLKLEQCDTLIIRAKHQVHLCWPVQDNTNQNTPTVQQPNYYQSKVRLWESKLVWSVHLLGPHFLLSTGWQSRLMVLSNTSWRPSFPWLGAPLCSSLLVSAAHWKVRLHFSSSVVRLKLGLWVEEIILLCSGVVLFCCCPALLIEKDCISMFRLWLNYRL